jgi:hypothetical protein
MTELSKGGRPPHEPTPQLRSQVESMCGFGIPADDIARSIGIGPDTLRKYYREELDNGTTKANTAVAQSLYKKALGDGTSAVTAAIFWLKTRAGWKETLNLNHEGAVAFTKIERVIVDSPNRDS